MAIKGRIRNIESRIGGNPCECQHEKIKYLVVHPGEPEPPAEVCPKCGRAKLRIIVKYVERSLWEAI